MKRYTLRAVLAAQYILSFFFNGYYGHWLVVKLSSFWLLQVMLMLYLGLFGFSLFALYGLILIITLVFDKIVAKLIKLDTVLIRPINKFYVKYLFKNIGLCPLTNTYKFYDIHLNVKKMYITKNNVQLEPVAAYKKWRKCIINDFRQIFSAYNDGIFGNNVVIFGNTHLELAWLRKECVMNNINFIIIRKQTFIDATFEVFKPSRHRRLQLKMFGNVLMHDFLIDPRKWNIYIFVLTK